MEGPGVESLLGAAAAASVVTISLSRFFQSRIEARVKALEGYITEHKAVTDKGFETLTRVQIEITRNTANIEELTRNVTRLLDAQQDLMKVLARYLERDGHYGSSDGESGGAR